jgi:metal-responsive CopG/Arc/MetJ family transcriptional regulator
MPRAILEEVEKHRGFNSRSSFIVTAVMRYMDELHDNNNNNQRVKGPTTNLSPTTTNSTVERPTPLVGDDSEPSRLGDDSESEL